MEEILEINGKEYVFVVNRKTLSIMSKLQADKELDENSIDSMFYALLKPRHNLSMKEIEELLDVAEKEYGIKQLMQFATELINEVFTLGEEEQNKYKTIAFLNRKKK